MCVMFAVVLGRTAVTVAAWGDQRLGANRLTAPITLRNVTQRNRDSELISAVREGTPGIDRGRHIL